MIAHLHFTCMLVFLCVNMLISCVLSLCRGVRKMHHVKMAWVR